MLVEKLARKAGGTLAVYTVRAVMFLVGLITALLRLLHVKNTQRWFARLD